MAYYHRGMKRRMEINELCGKCYHWQNLGQGKGYCQQCNQGRRQQAKACHNWIERIGG